tara:strand:- start:200 stop:388 length:189 start_codon:yes stop_codon:yes gene_type:complete
MNMTQKMFVATVRNFESSRRKAYFDTNEDAMIWVTKMIRKKPFGEISSYVIDNRDVHITEFI